MIDDVYMYMYESCMSPCCLPPCACHPTAWYPSAMCISTPRLLSLREWHLDTFHNYRPRDFATFFIRYLICSHINLMSLFWCFSSLSTAMSLQLNGQHGLLAAHQQRVISGSSVYWGVHFIILLYIFSLFIYFRFVFILMYLLYTWVNTILILYQPKEYIILFIFYNTMF